MLCFVPLDLLFKAFQLLLHENSFSCSFAFRNSCYLLPPNLEAQSSICVVGRSERRHKNMANLLKELRSHSQAATFTIEVSEEELG